MWANSGLMMLASLSNEERAVDEYMRLDIDPEWFEGGGPDATVFEYFQHHVQRYGAIPSAETVKQDLNIDLPETTEPPKYYRDKVREQHIKQRTKKAMIKADGMLSEGEIEAAREYLTDEMIQLMLARAGNSIVDYASAGRDLIMNDYKLKTIMGDEYGIRLGYPTLDGMTGGLMPGDVFVIAGRPASGKTYLGLRAAKYIWEEQKKIPLFLSMEMPILQIAQRMAAMQSVIPITGLRHAALSSKMFKRMKDKMMGIQKEGRPFWMIDGNMAANVNELMMYTKQLSPDVVIVDGAYLMNAADVKINADNWIKVKGVIEGLKKQIAQETGIPVVASYQLNRSAGKNKKSEDIGTEMLAYSDAIGQIASVVIGMMQEEDIESMVRKEVTILKGRNGEHGKFLIHWLFDTAPNFMNFDEVTEEERYNPMHWV